MKIALSSDLHGYLPEVDKDTDLFLIAGDICPDFNLNENLQRRWLLETFDEWLQSIKENGTTIVGIAGNHDFALEKTDIGEKLSWIYLKDNSVVYEDIKIWGSPWSPKFFNWAFMKEEEELESVYSTIPEDTDVIISHTPPKHHCDRTLPEYLNVGSLSLRSNIDRVKPDLVVCGHIHEGFGSSIIEHGDAKTFVMNVSYVDVNYRPRSNSVVYLERN